MNNNPEFDRGIKVEITDTQKARSTVNIIGCVLFVTTALEILASFLYLHLIPYIAKLTLFIVESVTGLTGDAAKKCAVNILGGAVYTQCISLIIVLLCFFLPFYIVSKYVLNLPFKRCMAFEGRFLPELVPIFAFAVFIGTYIANFADTVYRLIFPTAHSVQVTDTVELYGSAHTPTELVVMFVSLCIIPPIIEEYVFRGVIFKTLRKFGFAFAAITSAVLFGLVHASVPQAAVAMVFGFFFAYVTEISGDLRSAIVMHFLNNTISFLFSYLFPIILSAEQAASASSGYSTVITLMAIAGLIFIVRLEIRRQKILKETDGIAVKTVGFGGFVSAGSILVVLMFVYNLIKGALV